MSRLPDDDDGLAALLRSLPTPEPPAGFPGEARRRYLEAMEARDRRRVLTGLVAALIGLLVTVAVLGSVPEPVALLGWLAEATADLARWAAAAGVVAALVPLSIWAWAVLGSGAAVLSLVALARARSLAAVK